MNGILFTQGNRELIVKGLKTATRRLDGLKEINKAPDEWELKGKLSDGYVFTNKMNPTFTTIKPRYHTGEKLYIKEPWATMGGFDDLKPSELIKVPIWYSDTDGDDPTNCADDKGKNRSPLFLPARFARTFVEVTGTRAERLKDITPEDCLAEGIIHTKYWGETVNNYKPPEELTPGLIEKLTAAGKHLEANEEIDRETERCWTEFARQAYFALWYSINGQDSHQKKEWVWAYDFKLTEVTK